MTVQLYLKTTILGERYLAWQLHRFESNKEWAIVQSSVDGIEEATNLKVLERQLKFAWSQITPDILDNLVSSMPERVKTCVKLNGGYIGK